jgi:biopolymer transport protein TolR
MNVTPLVDVVLVLLIIFMVVIPQMEAGAAVDLPAARNPDAENAELKPTTLSVTRDGRFFFEKEQLAKDALRERLERFHQEKPEARLVLKADKLTEYEHVRTLFRTCQEIGFPGVSLQVIDKANQQQQRAEAP